MKFSLGFSPCPNDTFIFDALINKKIDTEGIDFDLHLEDVETLNQWAMQGRLDISKISYGVLPLVLPQYELLDAGGALGKGVGPLLISRRPIPLTAINDCRIAIPGQRTTAHLLFSLAFPEARKKEFMVFSGVEDAVLSGAVDCGVIIHENRFTYQQRGLVKLIDLGEFWERETGAPIPLGGIVVRKGLDAGLAQKINDLIRKSLEYAFSHYPQLPEFVRSHAQEMDEQVMRQHIDLYVNDYSLTLGEDGKKAIGILLQTYERLHAGAIFL
ncbi:1,4-dihydroxy-6-naphthoate synthase [Puia sp.]|jgi:1,4-dihydroxy-6-naphthoate synthase|uniref:1,4-dihydroxy-6-naphthoate synthase n=1 Tax=Puia sp. TaxID=2045100 RepID=UPI002F3F1EC2